MEELADFIREEIKSHLDVSKPYNMILFDDEKYQEKSVYVPDDIKKTINSWSKNMMLR
jgi:hypothetical protein